MPLGEGDTGARLKISLEGECTSFVVAELDDDIEVPWPPRRGVRTMASVMRLEAQRYVGGHAGVVATRLRVVLQDIDNAPAAGHTRGQSKRSAMTTLT